MRKNLIIYIISGTLLLWCSGCSKEDIPPNSFGNEEFAAELDGSSVQLGINEGVAVRSIHTEFMDQGVVLSTALVDVNCDGLMNCPEAFIEVRVEDENDLNGLYEAQELNLAVPGYTEYHLEAVTNLPEDFELNWNLGTATFLSEEIVDSRELTIISSDEELAYGLGLQDDQGAFWATDGETVNALDDCSFGFTPFEVFEIQDSTAGLLIRISREAIENYNARWADTEGTTPKVVRGGTQTLLYDCPNTGTQVKNIHVYDGKYFLYTKTGGERYDAESYPMDLSMDLFWTDGEQYRSDWSNSGPTAITIKDSYMVEYAGQDYHILYVDMEMVLRNRWGEELDFKLNDGLIYLRAL